jgi:Tol biopolymer transport system component
MKKIFLILLLVTVNLSAKDPVVEWIKSPDPKTGREVWQITSHDSGNVAVYFERQAFTANDKYVVFMSKRSGSWQIYRCDLQNGEIALVSPRKGQNASFTIHPDGKSVCYIHQNILYKTDVANLKETVWFDFTKLLGGQSRFSSSFSADAKYTLLSAPTDSGMAIFRVNLDNGDLEHAMTWENGRFSHPLICPTNPDLITFVPYPDSQNDMTLPMEKRARTWIVDMKTGEKKQFLTMPYGFRATHESWSWNGKRFFFYKKTQPGWVSATIGSVAQDGSDMQFFYSHPELRLGHGVSSNDGLWYISDGQDPNYNPLILLDLKTGKDTFLCWPNASINGKNGQNGHVHPSLSSSSKFVCYTSDVTGVPQVYVVPISDITAK